MPLINRMQMTIDYYLRKAFAKLVNKIYPVVDTATAFS